jgi:hypothetical protein
MSKRDFSEEEYKKVFLDKEVIRKSALSVALDIRKFEIDLYWKRATYFWTFIAASLAGFGAIQASSISNKPDLSVFLSCLGLVFSIGWLCVNRGSKYWQENWENHLDMLEDQECGPIYKVVLSRPHPKGFREHAEHIVNGPSPISVSKVNQIISLYVSLLWGLLLFYSLPPFSLDSRVNWYYVGAIAITALTCISFFTNFGATWHKGYIHRATIRTTKIEN